MARDFERVRKSIKFSRADLKKRNQTSTEKKKGRKKEEDYLEMWFRRIIPSRGSPRRGYKRNKGKHWDASLAT